MYASNRFLGIVAKIMSLVKSIVEFQFMRSLRVFVFRGFVFDMSAEQRGVFV